MIHMEARHLRSLQPRILMIPTMNLRTGKKDSKIAISVPMSVNRIDVV